MGLIDIFFWSALAGFALGVIDAMTFSPAWRWLFGGT